MAELTAEEQKFFATGDASVLGLSEPVVEEPKVAEPVIEETKAEEPQADPLADLQRQLATERASKAQLEASIARLSEQVSKPAEPAKVVPDPTTDPLGAMMHQLNEVTKTVTKLSETTAKQEEKQNQQQQFGEYVTNLNRLRDEFTKTQADFPEAYAHLRARRMEDYRDVGVPEHQIQQAMMQDELAVSQNAISQGKNPASVIYNMAKRYGYTGKTATTAANPAEKVANMQKGAAAAVNPAKGAAAVDLTFAGLKDASEGDLNKLIQDNKMWGNLVGGKNNDIF